MARETSNFGRTSGHERWGETPSALTANGWKSGLDGVSPRPVHGLPFVHQTERKVRKLPRLPGPVNNFSATSVD